MMKKVVIGDVGLAVERWRQKNVEAHKDTHFSEVSRQRSQLGLGNDSALWFGVPIVSFFGPVSTSDRVQVCIFPDACV